MFWRKNETPSAEISGAIRGAVRSGRYANRSIDHAEQPAPIIAAMNMNGSSSQTGTIGSAGPPTR